MSGYQVNLSVSPWQIVIASTPIGNQVAKAGVVQFFNTQQSATVTFAKALPNVANPIRGAYSLIVTMQNTVDPFPRDLIVRVSNFTIAGFTIKLNAPVDTNNYFASWMVTANVNG